MGIEEGFFVYTWFVVNILLKNVINRTLPQTKYLHTSSYCVSFWSCDASEVWRASCRQKEIVTPQFLLHFL